MILCKILVWTFDLKFVLLNGKFVVEYSDWHVVVRDGEVLLKRHLDRFRQIERKRGLRRLNGGCSSEREKDGAKLGHENGIDGSCRS